MLDMLQSRPDTDFLTGGAIAEWFAAQDRSGHEMDA
jgi:hypothetical protein